MITLHICSVSFYHKRSSVFDIDRPPVTLSLHAQPENSNFLYSIIANFSTNICRMLLGLRSLLHNFITITTAHLSTILEITSTTPTQDHLSTILEITWTTPTQDKDHTIGERAHTWCNKIETMNLQSHLESEWLLACYYYNYKTNTH